MPNAPRRRRRQSSAATTLTERRLALGLTQADLADLAGVSRRSITSLEAGKNTVRLDVLLAVARALGVALLLASTGSAQHLVDSGAATLLDFGTSGSTGDPALESASIELSDGGDAAVDNSAEVRSAVGAAPRDAAS